MFDDDDDCVLTYLSSKKPLEYKYVINYKEKECGVYILSNINTIFIKLIN